MGSSSQNRIYYDENEDDAADSCLIFRGMNADSDSDVEPLS